jgi:hypothetical protein
MTELLPHPTLRFQCRHIFADGHRCGSLCLRNEDFCYFHHTTRPPVRDLAKRRSRQATFDLQVPEDRTAVQVMLGDVLQRIADNSIDTPRARLLLYGIQIAANNLPRPVSPKPTGATEPNSTVHDLALDTENGLLALRTEFTPPPREKTLEDILKERWEREP